MKLSNSEKENIIHNMAHRFDMEIQKATNVVDTLDEALSFKNKDLFYQLRYMIHFHNDANFTHNVQKCALDTFLYLSSSRTEESEREDIKTFFYLFFESVFIQGCRYAKKVEKRRDTVQRILQHMSIKSNQILDTQQLMIANISHEMRTSLNAISGYISLMDKKGVMLEEDKNYLDKAHYATSTLRALVSDILDVSKMNSGQMEIKEEPFWLDEIILKCVDSITLALNKKNITFKTSIDFFAQKLIGDYQHIMEVLINILSNAIKYTDKGFVHLNVKKVEESDDCIVILFQVEDSGVGMTEEQTEQIFDPYSRFELEKQGVGLGLHIASRLADKLGGKLTVKSKLAEGSTFEFTLKVKQDSSTIVQLNQKIFCFFNNTNETKVLDQKFNFLKQFGAKVELYHDEKEFTNYLMNLKEDIPDIISIITYHDEYAKYDALINYLKNSKKFNKTSFIAEETETRLPLTHFDKIHERFSPISAHIQVLQSLDNQLDETDMLANNEIHILAVDDIETNLEVLKLFIENRYSNVVLDLAMGGYEAVGMYKTKSYDIIFLDLKMPGLNGFEVLEKLKAIKNLPPAYALTADVYKTTYDRVMQAGFNGLLEKPLQLDLLFEAIEKAVNEKHN